MSEDRLDRMEALADKILQGKDREEWEKDRKGIYLLLGRLTRSLSDFYNRFDQIDSRQADITEILRELKEDKKKSDNNED
jgi:hypothetical protein